jgi:hypothetical protein
MLTTSTEVLFRLDTKGNQMNDSIDPRIAHPGTPV